MTNCRSICVSLDGPEAQTSVRKTEMVHEIPAGFRVGVAL